MKKKVLFLLYENETGHTLNVAKNLNYLFEPIFFSCDTLNNYSHANPQVSLLKEFNFSEYKFLSIKKELKILHTINFKKKVNIDFDFLKTFEKNYLSEKIMQVILKDFSFNQIYNPRDYNYFPEDKQILFKTVEIFLKKIETLIKKNDFEFIYSGGKSNFIRNIFLQLAIKKNISFYGPSYRFGVTFLDNYSKKNLVQNLNNLNIKKNSNNLEKYRKNLFHNNKKNIKQSYNLTIFFSHLFFYLLKYLNYFKDLRHYYHMRVNKKKKNYFFIKSIFYLNFFLLRNTFRKISVENYLGIKTKELINSLPNKFIFYPLHFLPEGGVFDNKELFDEFFLIQQISKKLPVNYKIIVKPHPEIYNKGTEINSLSYYKSFSKIPNVEIVSPSVNSSYLIKKSLGIISVSSTVGLEAILFRKNSLNFVEHEFKGLKSFQMIDIKVDLEMQLNKKKNFSFDLNIIKKLFTYGINIDINDFIFKDYKSFEKNSYNNLVDKYLYYFKTNKFKF